MPLPSKMTRRAALIGASCLLLSTALHAQDTQVPTAGGTLTPVQAHALASASQITLIDIRRPDEWAATGSGAGARRLDLRRRDFVDAVTALVDGNTTAPIALICARGVRSSATARRLRAAGFTNVIDVPEGMLGSRSGPGWIGRKLPLNRS